MNEVFTAIKGTTTFGQLALLMCFHSKDSAYANLVRVNRDFASDLFRWNFRPLGDTGHGAIEFRQPPGVLDSKTTKMWITFACSFIQAAMAYSGTFDATKPPDLSVFKRFLTSGSRLCANPNEHLWDFLFYEKKQLPPGPYDLKGISRLELDKLKWKAGEKDITLEKFKRIYG
jgi:hypothetical protein